MMFIDFTLKGKVVLTDFNIAEEANGVGKGIFKDFNTFVNGSTLDIHLYWNGKGTTAIPDRGVYGPLISAIAVTPSKHFHNLLDSILRFGCLIIRLAFLFYFRL